MTRAFLVLLILLFAPLTQGAEIKVATWNLNWLTLRSQGDAALPADVHVRRQADFDRLRYYANRLKADVVAFQEVDGAEAASRVFDPAVYTIVTTDETVVQRVGLAVRRGIGITRNADYAALDVEPGAKFRLRDGLDATLALPGGKSLRMLVLHLKTGCQSDALRTSRRAQCALLAMQVAPLAAWAAARRAEGAAFLLAGDFNRVFDQREELGAALDGAAPMVRVTQGASDPCWDGGVFIDHIFAGGAARDWIVPDSLRVQVFEESGREWKERLSDHCPVSFRLRSP